MYNVDLSILMIMGLIAIAIGAVFGIMIGVLIRSATNKKRKPDAALHPVPPGLISIVHLWRKKRDHTLVVEYELEGLIETVSELSDEQKIKLGQTIKELQLWLGLSQPADSYNRPSMATPPTAVIPPAAVMVPPELKPVPATLGTVIKPGQTNPKPVSTSIAAQINDILQEMLINTPLEKKGISLFELPGKGMVVLVGLDHYESVDEVPDEIIRKVIKLAVQRWEKKMENKSTPH